MLILRPQLPKVSMRISNTILAGVVIIIGIITFVGGLRYIFDTIVNPSRFSTDVYATAGSILICLGLAPFIYGIVTIRDDLLHGKPVEENEEDEERKV